MSTRLRISPVFVASVFAFMLFAVALVPQAHAAQTVSMCIKNSGAAFVVGEGFKLADCKKNEQLVSFNIDNLAPQFTTTQLSVARAQPQQALSRLTSMATQAVLVRQQLRLAHLLPV